MDRTEAEQLQVRMESAIRETWNAQDPGIQVSSLLHADNKIDVTVISSLFEGRDGLEREAFFWPTFRSFSRSELIAMTYCLLLTPSEAERHFTQPVRTGSDNDDNWE